MLGFHDVKTGDTATGLKGQIPSFYLGYTLDRIKSSKLLHLFVRVLPS